MIQPRSRKARGCSFPCSACACAYKRRHCQASFRKYIFFPPAFAIFANVVSKCEIDGRTEFLLVNSEGLHGGEEQAENLALLLN